MGCCSSSHKADPVPASSPWRSSCGEPLTFKPDPRGILKRLNEFPCLEIKLFLKHQTLDEFAAMIPVRQNISVPFPLASVLYINYEEPMEPYL